MPDDPLPVFRPYHYPTQVTESPEPVRDSRSARQRAEALVAAATVEDAEQRKAEQMRLDAIKVRAKQALAGARAYRAEVDAAVAAAAALNAKPSPPSPLHFRLAARCLLGTRGNSSPYFPSFGGGQQDPTLDLLVPLRDKGLWLHDRLVDLDEAGRREIDRAEILCHRAVLERARVVSGEA